jgi:hypothetical protein
MHADLDVTPEALCELHKEWDELVAHRESIRAQPYDPHTEAELIDRLEKHHEKLMSMREAMLRQLLEDGEPVIDAGDPQRVAG